MIRFLHCKFTELFCDFISVPHSTVNTEDSFVIDPDIIVIDSSDSEDEYDEHDKENVATTMPEVLISVQTKSISPSSPLASTFK